MGNAGRPDTSIIKSLVRLLILTVKCGENVSYRPRKSFCRASAIFTPLTGRFSSLTSVNSRGNNTSATLAAIAFGRQNSRPQRGHQKAKRQRGTQGDDLSLGIGPRAFGCVGWKCALHEKSVCSFTQREDTAGRRTRIY